jgi:hypothetical protein
MMIQPGPSKRDLATSLCVLIALLGIGVVKGQAVDGQDNPGFSTIEFLSLPGISHHTGRATASPAPSDNFTGLLDNNTFSPPSIAAAAGTNRLMLALNSEVTVQDKTGGSFSTVALSNFWSSQISGGRVLNPKIVYDDSADRWIFTASGNPQSPLSSLLIGISATSQPTSTWYLYSLDIDATNVLWGDVGGVGFNDEWIVITRNLRTLNGNTFDRSRVYVFDKAQLYGINPVANIAATNVLLDTIDDFTPSVIPAVCRDSSPGVMYLIANGQGNDGAGNGTIRLFRMTSATNQVFSMNQIAQPVGQAPWDDVPFTLSGNVLPQKDSTSLIAAGDSRIQNVEYRGGSLWCAQTVFLPLGSGTRAGAQWWELSTSGNVLQFGRVEDSISSRSFAYPSIAVNRNRSVLLGYSSFSSDDYPSAGYSFRFDNEALGVLQTPVYYKPGEAPYSKTEFSSGLVRWGDYSATVIDPENDLDLWTIQQYASTPVGGVDRWGTHWAKLKLSTPPDGVFEVTVDPPSGSLIAAGVSQPFKVTVFDTFPVTNATVKVSILGTSVTSKTFQNNGLPPDQKADDNVYSGNINTPPTNSIITNVFEISAVGGTNTTLLLTNIYTIAPPPGNDFFVNAFKIPDRLPETNGLVIGGNFFASREIGEPLHAGVAAFGNSVWWNWAPTLSGPVLIDTLESRFNTVLAVYTNSAIDQLGVVTSANDVTNQFGQFVRDKAFVIFNARAGETYRIAVAGASTNEFGEIRLRMAYNGQPDETRPQVTITNLLSGTNVFANPLSGLIVNTTAISISGTAVDPDPNRSEIESVQITVNTNSPILATGTNLWNASLVLQPGSNLLQIVAIDTAKNRSIPLTFQLTVRAFDPVNDIFANASNLSGSNGRVDFSSLNATFEGNEPNHAGKIGGHSVWFQFTPSTDGLLSLSTTNSAIDTLLAIYSGERINELVQIGANDDAGDGLVHSAISVGVLGGRKYSIAVDGLGGAKGAVALHYAFQTTTNRLVSVSSTSGGAVEPGGGLFQQGSVLTFTARTNSGFDFVTWTGSVVSVDNPISFTVGQSNLSITAIFGRRRISDDFETGTFGSELGWSNQIGGNWAVQAAVGELTNTPFGGTYYLRTGLTPDSSTNEIRVVRELRAGPGGFDFKVTSEDSFGDRFEFLVDDVVYLSRQGRRDWEEFRTNFPAGLHVLRWRYIKDEANTVPFDSVYLDNVDLPVIEQVNFALESITDPLLQSVTGRSTRTFSEAVINPRFNRHTTNEFKIRIEGQANQLYVIQGSSDLANWVSFSTNYAPHGLIEYSDTNVITLPFRYYRAIIPYATNSSGRVVPTSF